MTQSKTLDTGSDGMEDRATARKGDLAMRLSHLRDMFSVPFWSPISPSINTLCDAVERFDARLSRLEDQGDGMSEPLAGARTFTDELRDQADRIFAHRGECAGAHSGILLQQAARRIEELEALLQTTEGSGSP